jgi:hypothetical protein
VISATRIAGDSQTWQRRYLMYGFACSSLVAGLVVVVFVGRNFAPLVFSAVRH